MLWNEISIKLFKISFRFTMIWFRKKIIYCSFEINILRYLVTWALCLKLILVMSILYKYQENILCWNNFNQPNKKSNKKSLPTYKTPSYLNFKLQFVEKNSFEFQKITFNLFGFHSWCICCELLPRWPLQSSVTRTGLVVRVLELNTRTYYAQAAMLYGSLRQNKGQTSLPFPPLLV